MKKLLEYLKPIIEDENKQPSRKRILEISCIKTAEVLTILTVVYKLVKPEISIAEIEILIGPLFTTGLIYSGITSFYQSKLNKEEVKQ